MLESVRPVGFQGIKEYSEKTGSLQRHYVNSALVFTVEGTGKILKPEPFLAGDPSEDQSEIEIIVEEIME